MVLALDTPEKAKTAGSKSGMKKHGASLDIGCWNSKKQQIMHDLVESKIRRHAEIQHILKRVKHDKIRLVHFSRFDMEWGAHVEKSTGEIKKGENKLGDIYNEFVAKLKI